MMFNNEYNITLKPVKRKLTPIAFFKTQKIPVRDGWDSYVTIYIPLADPGQPEPGIVVKFQHNRLVFTSANDIMNFMDYVNQLVIENYWEITQILERERNVYKHISYIHDHIGGKKGVLKEVKGNEI